jgi:hypothetical protein
MKTKTHYSQEEFSHLLVENFPDLSMWTLMKLKESLGIRCVNAGCQKLYRSIDVGCIFAWLIKAKREGRLILRDGFWIAPEFHPKKEGDRQ